MLTQLMTCALVLVIGETEELIEGHNDLTTVHSHSSLLRHWWGGYFHLYTVKETLTGSGLAGL